MIELFQMGGILFMSILTLQLTGVLSMSGRYLMKSGKTQHDLDLIKSLGLLAAITGVFGQLIGLFTAFQTIQQMGSVSPAVLAGGLKVSSITTLYGLLIYLIALSLWAAFKMRFAFKEH